MEIKSSPLPKSRALVKELGIRHNLELKQAKESGKKIVCCSGETPTEFFTAMGFAWYCPDQHAAVCAARGVSANYCDVAEAHDYSPDICSQARTDLGGYFSGYENSPIGGLPRPDLLYITSDCEVHTGWFRALSEFYDVPLIVLDTPTIHDGLDKHEVATTIEYVARQLAEHITILEQFGGRPCDWDRLAEVVDLAGRAARLYGEIRDMAKQIPAPLTFTDLCTLSAPLLSHLGTTECVAVFEEAKAEVQERVDRGEAAISEERYRLYFDGVPVWSKLGYLVRRLASNGANIVASCFGYANTDRFGPLDGSRPLASMAEGQLVHLYNKGTAHRIERLASIIGDFSVHGLVMQLTRTCPVYVSDHRTLVRELPRRTGLPSVLIEGDPCDTRILSEAEWDRKIDSFLEVLAQPGSRF